MLNIYFRIYLRMYQHHILLSKIMLNWIRRDSNMPRSMATSPI